MNFEQSHNDYSLFTRRVGSDLVIVLIYVDDILIIGSSLVLIQQVKKGLQDWFKIKDLSVLKNFLEIEFSSFENGMHMWQRKYTLELVSEMGLVRSKPVVTPLELNHKLTSVSIDKFVNRETSSDDK